MSDHEPEPTGYPKHDRTCLLSIHDAPEGSMPCTCGAVESGVGERMSDVSEAPSADRDAAFYAEHYSDWTVHELPLMVYVPMKDADWAEALALVREILDEAAFDIGVRVLPPGDGD